MRCGAADNDKVMATRSDFFDLAIQSSNCMPIRWKRIHSLQKNRLIKRQGERQAHEHTDRHTELHTQTEQMESKSEKKLERTM